MLVIRPETPSDWEAISEVNRLAFGRESEARLVETLRESADFDSRLSLIAIKGDRVVAHLLFSGIIIETPKGEVPALALAPVAVRPEFQNQGIGSQLVRQSLQDCRNLGHKIVIVVGHPDYYARFGFSPARAVGLEVSFPVPDEAFMVLELMPGALEGVKGTVKYPPAFSEV